MVELSVAEFSPDGVMVEHAEAGASEVQVRILQWATKKKNS